MESRLERGRSKLKTASNLLFSSATQPGAVCSNRYVQKPLKLDVVILAQALLWLVVWPTVLKLKQGGADIAELAPGTLLAAPNSVT